MKTVKKEFTAYAFSELSKEAQKTAVNEQLDESGLLNSLYDYEGVNGIEEAAEKRTTAAATLLLEKHGFSIEHLGVVTKIDFDLDLKPKEQADVMKSLNNEKFHGFHVDGTALTGCEIEMLLSKDAEKKT